MAHVWQVAGQPAVEEYLQSWDVSETDRLLTGLETERQKRVEQEAKLRQAVEDE